MSKLTKLGFINYIAYYFSLVFKAVAAFVIFRWIVVEIPKTEYAYYNVFLSTMSLALVFLGLGTYHAIQRYVPEFFQEKAIKKIKRLIKHVIIFQIIISIITGILLYIFRAPIASKLNILPAANGFIWLAILIIFQVLNVTFVNILYSLLLQHKRVVNEILFVIIKLAGTLIVLKYFAKDAYNLMIVLCISNVFFLIFNYIAYRKFINKIKEESSDDTLDYKRMWKFAKFKFLNHVSNFFLDISVDIYIISIILGANFTALYSFAMSTAKSLLSFLPNTPIFQVISPILIRNYKKNNDKNLLNILFQFYIKVNFFFIMPIAFYISIFSKKIIIYLFSPAYAESYQILIIGFWGLCIYSALCLCIITIIDVLEKPHIDFISRIIFSAYNIIMNLILIHFFKITGVAIATASTFIFISIFQYIMISKYITLKIPYKEIFKIILNIIPMLIFFYYFYDRVNSILTLICIGIAGGILYIICAFFNRIFTKYEGEIFTNATGKKMVF